MDSYWRKTASSILPDFLCPSARHVIGQYFILKYCISYSFVPLRAEPLISTILTRNVTICIEMKSEDHATSFLARTKVIEYFYATSHTEGKISLFAILSRNKNCIDTSGVICKNPNQTYYTVSYQPSLSHRLHRDVIVELKRMETFKNLVRIEVRWNLLSRSGSEPQPSTSYESIFPFWTWEGGIDTDRWTGFKGQLTALRQSHNRQKYQSKNEVSHCRLDETQSWNNCRCTCNYRIRSIYSF